jgi:hypothetical protein
MISIESEHNHVQTTTDVKTASLAPKASRSSVSFHPNVTVQPILHIFNYTKEEVESCWYKRNDMIKIKKHIGRTLHKMADCQPLDDKKYCARGLESGTKKGSKLKFLNRKRAIGAVLVVCRAQKEEGRILDEHMLAMVYKKCSRQCKMAAHLTGLADQDVAQALSGSDSDSEDSCGRSGTKARIHTTRARLPIRAVTSATARSA